MWSPTHVQVTVRRANGLLIKGNNGTNDCLVIIALGKEKYQTSIKSNAGPNVEWNEECELLIPSQGNTAEIVLTALHRNFLGVDEFLGTVRIPLAEFDVYERPKNRWHKLQAKPSKKEKEKKERGELEVKIGFIVKAGSLTDLSNQDKHKTSMGHLSHMAQSVGSSLLSIGTLEKRKGLKKFAKSIGNKVKIGKKHKADSDDDSFIGSSSSLSGRRTYQSQRQNADEADPGVISEDEDEFTLDDLSHKSSSSSIAPISTVKITNTVPTPEPPVDEWEQKLYGKQGIQKHAVTENLQNNEQHVNESNESHVVENNSPQMFVKKNKFTKKLPYLRKEEKLPETKSEHLANGFGERIIIGGEKEAKYSDGNALRNNIPKELVQKYEGKSREELIQLIAGLQDTLEEHKRRMRDTEDYLDELLLRVMETTPKILQNPYKNRTSSK